MRPVITPVEVIILEKPVDELDSAWVQQVDTELRSHGDRLTSIEKTLAENNEATFEIRDILTAAKGAFRVLGWLGQGTAYVVGQVRANGANVYVCKTAGTSAGAGGPTGTGTGIADNTVVWDFLSAKAAFVTQAVLT